MVSDDVLIVIPTDPHWTPPEGAPERALAVLRSVVGEADEYAAQRHTTIMFVDCGQNLQRIRCPNCRAEVLLEWWQDLMERIWQVGFTDLEVRMACCRATVSLNDLDFDWPAGFALVEVWARNPQLVQSLDVQALARLGEALGHPVRQIRAHV